MKIAIVKLSALGDIVYAMTVLQVIKEFNQDILIDWVVEECYSELLESHPHVNKVHTVNIKNAKKKNSFKFLLRELRKVKSFGRYDIVVDLQGLIKSALISYLIPSDETVGFDKLSIKEGVSSFFYNKTFRIGYEKNIIERNLRLIGFALDFPFNINIVKDLNPYLHPSKQSSNRIISRTKKNVIFLFKKIKLFDVPKNGKKLLHDSKEAEEK